MSEQSMREAMGRDVIAMDSAESVGAIKSFVVGSDVDHVERVQVSGGRRHAMFATWADLESFGDDAVMLKAAESVNEVSDDEDDETMRSSDALIGSRILDTAGFERGTVVDVRFDASSGAITAVVGSEGEIPRARLRSLGSYALVVAA